MMRADDYSPQRLADRARIQDAVLRYCRGVDRQDLELVRSAFHPDATDAHGAYHGGVDGLIEWMRARHATVPFTMHATSNILVEFAGPDRALVESYCVSTQRYPPQAQASLAQLVGAIELRPGCATDLTAHVRYVDVFERRDGEWRIRHRDAIYDAMMLREAPTTGLTGAAGWLIGRHDRSDPLYAARARLNLP